jgi:tRNA threonylcarbamoyladenosine biosynthesis protein TsaE
MEELGASLAHSLARGSVLVLLGNLGAGKTCLVRGLARGLSSQAAVTSPTYNLIHEYPTPHGPLLHLDAYRLETPQRLWAMGLAERLDDAAMTVIEWGAALLPDLSDPIVVRIEPAEDGGRWVDVARWPTP